MTTPSPRSSDDRLRPAALVEAMARAIYLEDSPSAAPPWSMLDNEDWDRNRRLVNAALRAASDAGFVLIPRAELEEAAAWIEAGPYEGEATDADRAMAAKLRQRGRG